MNVNKIPDQVSEVVGEMKGKLIALLTDTLSHLRGTTPDNFPAF